jgi:hypothetical protein
LILLSETVIPASWFPSGALRCFAFIGKSI